LVNVQKFLIITADDFGLHEAVNEAVEQASRRGVLSAASLMMGAPATDDAIRRARSLPGLRVGLHIVLADGPATLAPELVPALADTTGHMDAGMFVKSLRFFAQPTVRKQLDAEIRAQFRAFASTGLKLDHVNVHKHFHLHPTVLGMLLRIGRDYGAPAMRVPAEPLWAATRANSWLSPAQTLLLKPWIALMRHRMRTARIMYNDAIFGVSASGAMTEAKLLQVLARLPPGITEIYLHPATVSGSGIASSMADYRHADELAALLSPRVHDALAALDGASGGYTDIPRALHRGKVDPIGGSPLT
jgi:hopanoid biosynthesis associated protein HpnK